MKAPKAKNKQKKHTKNIVEGPHFFGQDKVLEITEDIAEARQT